jgi:hypothetical protein
MGRSRLVVVQTVFGRAVQDQRLNDLPDQVIAFDLPETAQPADFGGATLAVDCGIDVTVRVLLEEFSESVIGEMKHVAATHAK